MDMFLGTRGGCMGETCALALIIGGIYLIWRKVITITIPLSFIGRCVRSVPAVRCDPMYRYWAAGLMTVHSSWQSITPPLQLPEKGKIIFGLGCALITMVIRVFGSYPEGVSYSILLMNIVTPHINRMVRNKAFGGVQRVNAMNEFVKPTLVLAIICLVITAAVVCKPRDHSANH